jgi:hypothetical protein
MLILRGLAAAALPEPGPEADGLRLRLVVTPLSKSGKSGYEVQADLVSVSPEPIRLRAIQWRARQQEGGFREYLEGALSIESYPAIEPWLGQAFGPRQGATEPEYTLKPGEILSLKWRTEGRHLKNRVSNPLEVQNPEFVEDGLYSVHASIVLGVANRPVRLRSNEQLVPFGGSRKTPKPTYGPLWWAEEKTKTAMLGMGSLDQVLPGDRFLIHSGNIGMTWTLTITNVETDRSTGTLAPSQQNPLPAFPRQGSYAALIPKK